MTVTDNRYTNDLVEGVKRFQKWQGLSADGVIGPRTREWLNVTPRMRGKPSTMGLPSVGKWRNDAMELVQESEGQGLSNREIVKRYVLTNKYIWLQAYVQAEPEARKRQSIQRGPFSAVATFNLEYE